MAFALAAVFVPALVLAAEQSMDGPVAVVRPVLPEAAEKHVVLQNCAVCHPLDRVMQSGGTSIIWDDRIRRMIRWGAKIPPEQVAPVAAYLAAALPVRLRPPAALASFENVAVGRAEVRDVTTTIRLVARYDAAARQWTSLLPLRWVDKLEPNHRVRLSDPRARGIMVAGKIAGAATGADQAVLTIETNAPMAVSDSRYLLELVIEQGEFLSVPNDAILENGTDASVYVQTAGGEFEPRVVSLGVRGDLYTEVTAGIQSGEEVVTLGGFLVDAELRLRNNQ